MDVYGFEIIALPLYAPNGSFLSFYCCQLSPTGGSIDESDNEGKQNIL